MPCEPTAKDHVEVETLGRARTTLSKDGRIEGYVSAQVGGLMPDCGKLWMSAGETSSPRRSRSMSRPRTPRSSPTGTRIDGTALRFYSSHKGKGRKTPLLVVTDVTQAYIGFDRWGQSKTKRGWLMIHGMITLAVQGTDENPDDYFGLGASPDRQEGWLAVEPDETITGSEHNLLDWLIGIHDTFGVYGRPEGWIWDANNSKSLTFAHPTVEELQVCSFLLFLREACEFI